MKRSALLIIAATVLSFFGRNAYAQTVASRLDSLFTAPGNFESLNGGVLVAENGKIIYQKYFGFADFEKNRRNAESSSFEIASNTKTFTSTAILQLRDKGKFRLDDPFVKYFPAFPYPTITIRNLLTHTSGLGNEQVYVAMLKDEPARILTNADIIPCLVKYGKPLRFQPGDNWEYNNINFELLALLVEKTSGSSYAGYLRKHIFSPAGMTHTYVRTEKPKTADTNRVTTYMPSPGQLFLAAQINPDSIRNPHFIQMIHNFWGLVGDGGIVSTLQDMLNYSEALYSGKLLKASTMEEAYTPARLTNDKDYEVFPRNGFRPGTKYLGRMHYGLGWVIHEDTSMGRIVAHAGKFPGIWAGFLRNISKRQTIITYDNTAWSGADLLNRMALDILNDKPIEDLLSKKSLAQVYTQCLMQKGADAAFSKLMERRDDSTHYFLDQYELNSLGYQFLANGYLTQSLETFKVNTLLFPKSANVYDSYAEALAQNGNKDAAVAMYRKSILMDPTNENGKKQLKKLTATP
jgi:CubicO group peptidase (beta-lactamase class C family)